MTDEDRRAERTGPRLSDKPSAQERELATSGLRQIFSTGTPRESALAAVLGKRFGPAARR